MGATEQLTEILRAEYNRLDEQDVEAISPAELANYTYCVIDPSKVSPDLVMAAAILTLRQMARAICRARNREEQEQAENGGQETLFEMELQPRYPATRNEDEVYVQRERLTFEERQIIIAKLRAEARAKSLHADALEAETEKLIRAGRLKRPQ
jgi:hypothetical protein